ncbi:unnamed protein product [Allacma fusca]|uniref:Uncharacterized protein n=1 Tax=Allacma fusca TaxID=39272 RepID=A0A8J2KQM2_9HEXA|nr:unnamed protein product [Allacma fusca]
MPLAIWGNVTLPGAFKPMVILSKPAVTFPIGFAFPKNSILTDTFNLVGKYWRPSGLIRKWNQDVYSNFTRSGKSWMKSQKDGELFKKIDAKWRNIQDNVKPFRMENVIAAFFIWGVPLLLSGAVFSWETFFSKIISESKGHMKL